MERPITVSGHSYPVEYPDKCPICHHYGEIRIITISQAVKDSEVQVVYQCAYQGCKSYFIGYYGEPRRKPLKALKPQKPLPTELPQTIRELSPSFVEIYEEASEAQHLGMKQIAGPGYRKAFEFLIKDYAKSLSPDRAEEIEKMFSGKVVKQFISDTRIQAVAKRALWLGNDEAHYLKEWRSHDIDDLVRLIRLAINWIEIEQNSKDYQEEMPD